MILTNTSHGRTKVYNHVQLDLMKKPGICVAKNKGIINAPLVPVDQLTSVEQVASLLAVVVIPVISLKLSWLAWQVRV